MDAMRPMSVEEFADLLDLNGSRREAWPPEQLAVIDALLAHSAEASTLLEQAQALDKALHDYQPPLRDLSDVIMAAVPLSLSERLVTWLFPSGPGAVLRPVCAGALPLLMGVALGISMAPADTLSFDGESWEISEREILFPVPDDVWYE